MKKNENVSAPVKNDVLTIDIVRMSGDGSGIGFHGTTAIFVPFTLVGERVRCVVIKRAAGYCAAKLLELLVHSPSRETPDCAVFRRCGGCQLLHAEYNEELLYKTEFVRSNLRKIGGIDPVILQKIVASPEISHYRNKAAFPVRWLPAGDGKPKKAGFGFFAQRSHRLISPGTDGCLLQNKSFCSIADDIVKFMNSAGIAPYDETDGSGFVRHLLLRSGEKEQVLLCIVATADFPLREALVEHIKNRHSEIKTIILNINRDNTNVILGKRSVVLFGNGRIEETVCGVKVSISHRSFFQVNRKQSEALYSAAIDMLELRKTDILLDLYCGAGLIGLIAAPRVRQIIGVESESAAVADAKSNAAKNGIENARFICADAAQGARTLSEEGVCPTVLVVDPPRAGLSSDTIAAIFRLAPERMAYISCNSATLARDLKLLSDRFETVSAVPFDMFPKTCHVETVVLLRKRA